MSIRIHPSCLVEILDEHSIGTVADMDPTGEYVSEEARAKKLYNCPECHSTITGKEVKTVSDMYFAVRAAYPHANVNMTLVLREINKQITMQPQDAFLRYQLEVYKKYLK